VIAIQQRALRDFIGLLGAGADGSSVKQRDGVIASVVPACPRRSIANSVSYAGTDAMIEQLGPLAELYAAAGIDAWTVWTPDYDGKAIAALERSGHAIDASPAAMAMELDAWQGPEIGDLDWDVDGSAAVSGPLNDLAYGLDLDGVAPALTRSPDFVRNYQAREDGEVVCVLGTIDNAEDLGFYFVATHPDHRGKGLASRLMAAAIAAARERGMRTSSLQASKMGEPLYLRLGYEPHFRFHMYEWRAA
jgi:GNAT superfamily N-acetyltransferase